MAISKTKSVHDGFQSDLKSYQKSHKATVFDVMVVRHIQSGTNEISRLEKILRMNKERIIGAISKHLFKVNEKTIDLI
ncbi:MAG: hypothetical protein CMJ20_01540 [Phycisphaeraceae bacterium]|nr:hypothetical protein [Phycisphaeraceae bacterium]|tara:strand:- start:2239 stop:2472 length:234 start_codon:yes stop_codon:yes gene_type:complete